MKKKMGALLACLVVLFTASAVYGDTYKVAVKSVATAEPLMKLFRQIGEETKNTFEFQVVPSGRMIALIEQGQVDIGLPQGTAVDPAQIASLKYDIGTAPVYQLVFVLYTNKSKPLDIASIKAGNTKNYSIETNTSAASVFEFGFTSATSTSVESSLKKVDAGRIDGCIFGLNTGDTPLKALGLTNVKRQPYISSDQGVLLRKGQKGGALDKALAQALQSLRGSGRYAQVVPELVQQNQFVEW